MREPNEITVSPNEVIGLDSRLTTKNAEFYLREYAEYLKNPDGDHPFLKRLVLVWTADEQLVCMDGNNLLYVGRLLGLERMRAYLLLNDEEELPFLYEQWRNGQELYRKGKMNFMSSYLADVRTGGDVDVFHDDANRTWEGNDPRHRSLRTYRACIAGAVEDAIHTHDNLKDIPFNADNLWHKEVSPETREQVIALL